jgi:hypothetical protein
MQKVLYLLLAVIAFGSCDRPYVLAETHIKEGVITSCIEDNITIKTDTLGIEFYEVLDRYYTKDSVSIIGLNYETHSLDILNLTKRSLIKHIKLEKEGPNQIQRVTGIEMISNDSILLSDDDNLYLVDGKGVVFWKFDKNNKALFKGIPKGYLKTKIDFNMGYNKAEKCVYLFYLPEERKDYWDTPFLIEVNIENETARLVPVFRPEYQKKNYDRLGYATDPESCFHNNRAIINFGSESNIYEVNLLTDSVIEHGGESRFSKNLLRIQGENESRTDYRLSTIYFFNLIYDPYRNLYYRFHWGEMPVKKNGKEYNTLYDKPTFITVFDDKFNYLYEFRIYNRVKSGATPTPEGLIVFPGMLSEEDEKNGTITCSLIKFN